jgi:hypothetical protein
MWVRLAIALTSVTAPAFAHHGAAAYDMSAKTTLQATVTRFEWQNPHALISFDVASETGNIERWTVETAGLVILVRAGWNKGVLKPGDKCTVIGYRAKKGSPTMILQRVVLPDGKELGNFLP